MHPGGYARPEEFLLPNTIIARQTGSLDGSATGDVDIITLPRDTGHITIAVFARDLPRSLAQRKQTITHSARALYNCLLYQPLVLLTSVP